MRCLYCNKKLSLLKLAKGDSFCSPQHFDAHQLRLSKDAFDRLSSVPAEGVPKAPLVVERREETPPDLPEENGALARLAAFAPPAAAEVASQSPPYAPFASSPLPSFTLNPPFPIANGPEAGEAVEPARDLAFPVHETEEVACILNLYLQLSLGEAEPKNWTPEQHLIVAPEHFRLEISQPPFGVSPEFPEIEDLAPVEPALPIEAVAPVNGDHSIEALPFAEAAPSIKPVMHAEPVSLTPIEPSAPRVTFLLAPSFEARTGTPIRLHNAASSVPNGSTLAPILEKGNLPPLDSCGGIPNSTRFAGTRAFHLQDSKAHLASRSELPVKPAFLLPNPKQQTCEDAWIPSNRKIAIVLPALEASRESMHSLDRDLPEPASLMVRPDASNLSKVDPQQLLAGTPIDIASLFHGVLETCPQGREPLFVDPPADATESAWRATLAPFLRQEPLPTAWQHRTSYCSSPDPIAEGCESRMLPIEPLRYAPGSIKIDRIDNAGLPAPYIAKDLYKSTEWPEADSACLAVAPEPCLVFIGSTMLPDAANVPAGSLKTGSGAPSLRWEPSLASPQAPRAVKFLPAREGAVLPPAKRWERLEAVPR
jgi:hypothetical protein